MRPIGTTTLALFFLSEPAAAVCLNPFGCAPSTYDECLDEATRRPTDKGVLLARDQCYAKFKSPEDARRAKESERQAQAFVDKWNQKMGGVEADSGSKISALLGTPGTVRSPAPCTRLKGKLPEGVSKCVTWEWADPRPNRICPQFKSACYFTLELENSPAQKLWVWWPDSI